MAAPTRFTKLGVSGRTATANNSEDTYLQTFEFDITAVLSASAQDTGVKAPKTINSFGGYLIVNTPESTGITQTIDIGITGSGTNIVTAADVSAAGKVGTVSNVVIESGGTNNFSYTLGSGDFVELDARMVIWVIGSDV